MSYNIKVLYKIKKRKRGNFMKKKGLAISAVAVSLAAAAMFAGGDCQTVKAADVTDKSAINIAVDGDCEEKSLSKADREAIANQLGYEYFSGDVAVCGSNTTAYVDWENSSIPYWKAYDSFVLVPVLSRDDNGNLVIEKNEDGSLKTKINGGIGWNGSKKGPAIVYDETSEFGISSGSRFNILPKKYWDTSSWFKDWNERDRRYLINGDMGSKQMGLFDNIEIDDAYIVRIYYTSDNLGNIQAAAGLDEGTYNTDPYGATLDGDDWNNYYTLKDRDRGFVDFWFLPEGVSTVLNYANGIQKDGDAWYYYKDGVVDTSYTGLAKYNGSWWYVKNGKIDFSATTLCKYNGTWWYVKNGKVDFGSTTLCKYNGSWWYVSGGKVNFGATGLCKYNGTWWYVKNGKVDFGSTTLCKYNGSWWYISGGKVNFGATGLCKYNGTWWYVKNGKVSFTTTLCKYNGIWWYINNGAVNFNKTTLVKYGSNWYAVAKGQVAWKYTGKLAYNGRYFNVVNGVVKF